MIDRLASLPTWLRCSAAVVVGLVSAFGFAPFGWWPLLLLGIAGLGLLVLSSQRAWQALLAAYCWGLGLLGVSLAWMSVIFVEAMLGLVAMEALFYAGFGWLLWLVRRSAAWPLWGAALWVGTEFSFSRVPFDGFPWMRVGYALVDTPLAGFLPLGGVPLVGFLAALTSLTLCWVLVQRRGRRGLTVVGVVGALTAAVGLLLGRWAPEPLTSDGRPGSVWVGYVQGNAPGGGIYGLGEARTITRNHTAETIKLAAAIADGSQHRADFVVWPENGTDLDPFRDAQTANLVDQARRAVGVPLFVGSITSGPGANQRQTAALWYDPDHGVTARYDKRNIVPFGEWVPYREILEPLFPVVAYVGEQSVPGTKPGVLDVTVNDQPLHVGDLICYEVAFDDTVRQTVTAGGEVLLVQSSNAMYAGTAQVHQQFAITRARAAELRREILVVTTTGISGLIRADGSVAFVLPERVPASGVTELPRRSNVTPAVSLAGPLELLLALAGVIGVGVSRTAQRQPNREQPNSAAE